MIKITGTNFTVSTLRAELTGDTNTHEEIQFIHEQDEDDPNQFKYIIYQTAYCQ